MMTLKSKSVVLAAFAVIISGSLTGCKNVQIFEKQAVVTNGNTPLSNSQLEYDTYYVKDGTKFYKTYPVNGDAAGATTNSQAVDEAIVCYVIEDQQGYLPTHYKDELVAYKSSSSDIESVNLTRYKDLGFSFGIYNGTFDSSDNYLHFTSDNLSEGSEAADIFSAYSDAKDFRLASIDGKPLTADKVDLSAGVIPDLKENNKYTVAFYAGTEYHEVQMKADTQMFSQYEAYTYDSSYIKDTPNGYAAFMTPGALKSGYYCINGEGLFRYYDHAKVGKNEEKKETTGEMNVSYYKTDAEKIAAYSRQYSVNVENKTKNITIDASYDETIEDTGNKIDEKKIKGYVTSPDGTNYTMNVDTDNNQITLDLAEAVPGKWTVNIIPKNLTVNSIQAIDNSAKQELTTESTDIVLDKDRSNIVFRATVTGDIGDESMYSDGNSDDGSAKELTGTIVADNGQTFIMTVSDEKDAKTADGSTVRYIEYKMAYAKAGTYKVNINHYPEKTTIGKVEVVDNTQTNTDVIIVDD